MPENTEDTRYAPTAWGAKTEDLPLPSGQVALVRKIGPEELLAEGLIDSYDSLTGIVQNELIPQAEGKPQVDVKKLTQNTDALKKIIELCDRVLVAVVVAPKVVPDPGIKDRQDHEIYPHMVSLEDKMFILQYSMGGVKDYEQFRKESQEAMAGLGEVEVSRSQPKHALPDQ